MDKRCFSTQEAWAYLGLKRRSFKMHIAPLLSGKGTKVGVSVIYERTDLDAAWDKFKLAQSSLNIKPNHAINRRPSAGTMAADTEQSRSTGYAAAVAKLRERQKTGKR